MLGICNRTLQSHREPDCERSCHASTQRYRSPMDVRSDFICCQSNPNSSRYKWTSWENAILPNTGFRTFSLSSEFVFSFNMSLYLLFVFVLSYNSRKMEYFAKIWKVTSDCIFLIRNTYCGSMTAKRRQNTKDGLSSNGRSLGVHRGGNSQKKERVDTVIDLEAKSSTLLPAVSYMDSLLEALK